MGFRKMLLPVILFEVFKCDLILWNALQLLNAMVVILQSDSDDPIDSQCSEIEVRHHSSEMRTGIRSLWLKGPSNGGPEQCAPQLGQEPARPAPLSVSEKQASDIPSPVQKRVVSVASQAPPCAKHLSRNRPHAIGEHATRDANAIHVRRLAPAGPFAASALRSDRAAAQ